MIHTTPENKKRSLLYALVNNFLLLFYFFKPFILLLTLPYIALTLFSSRASDSTGAWVFEA